jgi:hypothetical protein
MSSPTSAQVSRMSSQQHQPLQTVLIARSSGITGNTSSIRDYLYENGRRYHSLHSGTYALPNDEVSSIAPFSDTS